jgi:GNAT superfamily N-acetyltransferase
MFEPIRTRFFAYELPSGVVAQSVDEGGAFWGETVPLMNAIFPPYSDLGAYSLPDVRAEKLKPLSRAFDQAHHERFLFRAADGTAVGYSYGDMRDRETFFMTSSGVLPAYQRRGLYTAFTKRLLAYLYALGYERVVSNHQPNNRAVIIAKLKLGFNITAVNLDERWGAQAELTYLFHEDRRRGYARAFALEQRPTPISDFAHE